MKVFEDLKCSCSTWLVRSCWEPMNMQQLLRIDFCSLTSAEAKADDVNPITV